MSQSTEVAQFVTMARYNQWMNEKLYDAAATLPEPAFSAQRGAFFGSLAGTLNHLLLADTIWLQRFAAHPARFSALDPVRALAAPTMLSEESPPPLVVLRPRRQSLDSIIAAWVNQLHEDHVNQPLHYSRLNGDMHAKRFGSLIMHFFNHQTHHRGQASTLLFQAGVDMGATDLLVLIPEFGQSA